MLFFIIGFQILEDRERKNNVVADQLKREQRYLTRRLETLTEGHYRVRQERSISECSTSTNSTTSSTSESGECCSFFSLKKKFRGSYSKSMNNL